jgi:hypothetical protein
MQIKFIYSRLDNKQIENLFVQMNELMNEYLENEA